MKQEKLQTSIVTEETLKNLLQYNYHLKIFLLKEDQLSLHTLICIKRTRIAIVVDLLKFVHSTVYYLIVNNHAHV